MVTIDPKIMRKKCQFSSLLFILKIPLRYLLQKSFSVKMVEFAVLSSTQKQQKGASDWLVNMKIVCNFPLHDWSNCVIIILFRIDQVVKICGKIHPKIWLSFFSLVSPSLSGPKNMSTQVVVRFLVLISFFLKVVFNMYL